LPAAFWQQEEEAPGTTSLGHWPQTAGLTLPAEKFPRIKTETVPSDVRAGHVLEMKRDPSDPECGHIKHLTRTSELLEILQRKNLICIKLTMATTRERSTHMLI
jgi:hypothetical protein